MDDFFSDDQQDESPAPVVEQPRVPKGFRTPTLVTAQPVAAPDQPAPAPPVDQPVRVPKGFRTPRLQSAAPYQESPADHLAGGQLEPGNLEPYDRKVLNNPDGSYSTTSSISVGSDRGEVIIPTVVDGKRLSKTNPDGTENFEEAIENYRRTGKHFGVFDTPENADRYAQHLHELQEEDINLKKRAPGYGALTLEAFKRGLTANMRGGKDAEVHQAPSEIDARYGEPLHFGMPDADTPKKVAYQAVRGLTETAPELAGGITGGAIGTAAGGGPWGTAIGAGAGAAAVHIVKQIVPIFDAELKATPQDPDGAYTRAAEKMAISAGGTAAMFAAFGATPFEGTIKNLAFQAFGLQPAIGAAEQVGMNAVDNKPLMENVPEAAINASVQTIVPAVAHHGTLAAFKAARGLTRGGEAPPEGPPDEPPPPPAGLLPSPDNIPPYTDPNHQAAATAATEGVQERADMTAGGYRQKRAQGSTRQDPNRDGRVMRDTRTGEPFYEPDPNAPPDTVYGQGERAPQSRDDMVSQDEADDAFKLAERQRGRLEENPQTLDTQAAGRPEGVNPQTVHLDEGFPVRILERRLVPGPGNQMVDVAKVERYDPRTDKTEEGAVAYEVPMRQLKKKQYPVNPRMAADFQDRAKGPKSPEQPRAAGPGEPAREPKQTFRATAPDPNEDFPAAGLGRSPLPEQPEGPMPGPERPRTEEDVIREYERRQKEGPSPEREAAGKYKEGQFSSTVGKKDADGRHPVDEYGYVLSDKGGPVRFHQKQRGKVAKLLLKLQSETDQHFELANHPAGGEFLTIKERGRSEPPPPPPGGQHVAVVRVPKGFKEARQDEPPPRAPPDLMDFLAEVGIDSKDPALKDLSNKDVLNAWHGSGKDRRRILRKGGLPLHKAVARAAQEGFFPTKEATPDNAQPYTMEDIGHLDRAIGQHKKGNRQYRDSDMAEGQQADEIKRFGDENRRQIEQRANELGIIHDSVPDHELEAQITRQETAKRLESESGVDSKAHEDIDDEIDRLTREQLAQPTEEAADADNGASGGIPFARERPAAADKDAAAVHVGEAPRREAERVAEPGQDGARGTGDATGDRQSAGDGASDRGTSAPEAELGHEEFRRQVAGARPFHKVSVFSHGKGAEYDPISNVVTVGDNVPRTRESVGKVGALRQPGASGKWRDATVEATIEDGTKTKVNAGTAADAISARIKKALSLLECLK